MNEPSLQELQRWMKSRIELKSSKPSLKTSEISLNPQGGEAGVNRISVYQGGYTARTQDAIKQVYEALCHVIGARKTVELAQAYASKFPSQDYNLNFYGRHLPEFLESYPLSRELPFLVDLAKLEWKVCHAFHSFEQEPLDSKKLASLSADDWDNFVLKFQPSVDVIQSEWPILDIWQVRHTAVEEINVNLVNRPQSMLIFRRGLQVHCELIDDRQSKLLSGLLAGGTLSSVCEKVAMEFDDELPPISEWFSSWMSNGLIIGFDLCGQSAG